MPQTDKIGHGYTPMYQDIIATLAAQWMQPATLSLLEIGVANGDSLPFWANLALEPVTAIYELLLAGVDRNVNSRWPEDRPGWVNAVMLHADQGSPDLATQLDAATGVHCWDLIVDDASHQLEPTRATWHTLWPRVRPGGAYVIEDWSHGGADLFGLARELLDVFVETAGAGDTRVKSITYHPGMIVVWKTTRPPSWSPVERV